MVESLSLVERTMLYALYLMCSSFSLIRFFPFILFDESVIIIGGEKYDDDDDDADDENISIVFRPLLEEYHHFFEKISGSRFHWD